MLKTWLICTFRKYLVSSVWYSEYVPFLSFNIALLQFREDDPNGGSVSDGEMKIGCLCCVVWT